MTPIQMAACHMVGDFAMQPDWMGKFKATHWEINGYHALTYTAPFALMGASPVQCAAVAVTHFMIDPMKARWHWIDKIWVDQILHAITLWGIFTWL